MKQLCTTVAEHWVMSNNISHHWTSFLTSPTANRWKRYEVWKSLRSFRMAGNLKWPLLCTHTKRLCELTVNAISFILCITQSLLTKKSSNSRNLIARLEWFDCEWIRMTKKHRAVLYFGDRFLTPDIDSKDFQHNSVDRCCRISDVIKGEQKHAQGTFTPMEWPQINTLHCRCLNLRRRTTTNAERSTNDPTFIGWIWVARLLRHEPTICLHWRYS